MPGAETGQKISLKCGRDASSGPSCQRDLVEEGSMSENIVAAEIKPLPNQARQAALALQRKGFQILHIGPTISVQGSQSLWESIFNVSFEPQKKTVLAELEKGEVTYPKAITKSLHIPVELKEMVEEVTFVEPPEFY